jgi:hypothetical protein
MWIEISAVFYNICIALPHPYLFILDRCICMASSSIHILLIIHIYISCDALNYSPSCVHEHYGCIAHYALMYVQSGLPSTPCRSFPKSCCSTYMHPRMHCKRSSTLMFFALFPGSPFPCNPFLPCHPDSAPKAQCPSLLQSSHCHYTGNVRWEVLGEPGIHGAEV